MDDPEVNDDVSGGDVQETRDVDVGELNFGGDLDDADEDFDVEEVIQQELERLKSAEKIASKVEYTRCCF
jgi:hypothetical protein